MPADFHRPGANPPSYDKLPGEVIAKTAEKYREALIRLTGKQGSPVPT